MASQLASAQMKRKLSGTNFSLENNLSTFRLNAPVIIRRLSCMMMIPLALLCWYLTTHLFTWVGWWDSSVNHMIAPHLTAVHQYSQCQNWSSHIFLSAYFAFIVNDSHSNLTSWIMEKCTATHILLNIYFLLTVSEKEFRSVWILFDLAHFCGQQNWGSFRTCAMVKVLTMKVSYSSTCS